MQLGLGVLRWTPDQFWKSTVREIYSALEGYNESITGKKATDEHLSKSEIDEVKVMMDKFPDNPKPQKKNKK